MKPSIPKGTRDFSPTEMARRNFILNTIKTIYERYGFQQIETPVMENLSTLMGKYGEEGDKLIFKILNSGNYFSEFKDDNDIIEVKNKGEKSFTLKISEKALRYDLTVPFARYVVMHQNEITFPFKRYQMQPVWRADRPQKGRYREFYQCDADVIGSDSLLNEVELVQIIQDVFSQLKVGVSIKINNRKILSGIAEIIGEADKIIDITVAIDKLDKIGIDKVNEELKSKEVSETAIQKIQPLFSVRGSTEEKLSFLNSFLATSEIGRKGIEEINYILNLLNSLPNGESRRGAETLDLDITLARGLNYYTGAIFEVKVNDSRSNFSGSILGGGRYDDLTGIFGLPNVSGVGISFGIDRIYDVMLEMNLFEQLQLNESTTKVLFVNFGKEEEKYSLSILSKLRNAGINSEIYPDAAAKMKKQMSYADAKKIPYVVLIGTEEMLTGKLTLKNMQSGEQEKVEVDELIKRLN
jgi:histidyl-tRNA synthetase